MILLQLFYEFFKTGLFAVGGGLATLPFLQQMSVKTGWFTLGQLADMLAVSESTPGPIGVNMATYVGYLAAGVPGAIVATLGLITPSLLIILLVAALLRNFKESRLVQGAFYGLRPASTGLVAAAGLHTVRLTFWNGAAAADGWLAALHWKGMILAALLLVVTRVGPQKKLHPIVWILLSAAAGVVFRFAGA